tara:strand:+ start:752 stop:937 length:186 start_codon:yes stop_codon:yes gene_type:complete
MPAKERVFLDLKEKEAQSSGIYVRLIELKRIIEQIEDSGDVKVIGIVYDGTNSVEIITKNL